MLSSINIRLDDDKVAYIPDHAGSALVLCDDATRTTLPNCPVPFHRLCLEPDAEDGLDLFAGAVEESDLLGSVDNEFQSLALNYTLGTTGRPKGVVYTHRGAYLNAISNAAGLGFDQRTCYLWTLPMFHCNGSTHTWALTAAGGLHVCLDTNASGRRRGRASSEVGETGWAFIETRDGRDVDLDGTDQFCRENLAGSNARDLSFPVNCPRRRPAKSRNSCVRSSEMDGKP